MVLPTMLPSHCFNDRTFISMGPPQSLNGDQVSTHTLSRRLDHQVAWQYLVAVSLERRGR